MDFDRRLIVVREGKGKKNRITMLPAALVPELQTPMAYARAFWASDRALKRPGRKRRRRWQTGIRTIQELLGHSSVDTTTIYTYVLNRGSGVLRPLDDGFTAPSSQVTRRPN